MPRQMRVVKVRKKKLRTRSLVDSVSQVRWARWMAMRSAEVRQGGTRCGGSSSSAATALITARLTSRPPSPPSLLVRKQLAKAARPKRGLCRSCADSPRADSALPESETRCQPPTALGRENATLHLSIREPCALQSLRCALVEGEKQTWGGEPKESMSSPLVSLILASRLLR